MGGRTARIDDPDLTVRHAPPPRVPPVRVVADSGARLPADSRLARSVERAPVLVLTGPGAPADRVAGLREVGVEVAEVPSGTGGLDPRALVDALGERGIRTVLCEGGGRLGASLIEADRVDRLYLFYAPVVFGDAGVQAFPGPVRFRGERVETRAMGVDTLVTIDRSA